MSVAFLFPGQGAQTSGFLHRLPSHPVVQQTLAEAADVLGVDPCRMDDADSLTRTTCVQLGLLIAAVAVSRALSEAGVTPGGCAGLSVGAFGAAVTCGSLSLADALRVVKIRGDAMHEAYPRGYGMAAINGLDERQVADVVATVGGAAAELYLSSVNAPRQMIIAGAVEALEAALRLARSRGAHDTRRLNVNVPSHCPLLMGVSMELQRALVNFEMRAPQFVYVSNARARAVVEAAGVREDLINNVSHTVRWHDSITLLQELGMQIFIELPPGNVLTRLAKEAFPDKRSVATDGLLFSSLSALVPRDGARGV